MLFVDGVEFCYKTEKILDGITFRLNKGESVAILGTNGAGKSTLLKSIAKSTQPKKGCIYVDSQKLSILSFEKLSKIVSYAPQANKGSFLSVFDFLLLGKKHIFGHSPSKKEIKEVANIIDALNLKHISLKPTNQLSGGELQKVVIARAILQDSKIILFDEPTNNLDIKNQMEILSFIQNIVKKRNILAILVMHDINLALKFCNKFIFMKNGKIVYEGDDKIVNKENIKEIYGVDVEIVQINQEKNIIFSPKSI